LWCLTLAACGVPAKSASDASPLATAHVESPGEPALPAACTPTGPELCFNATDDNCNGVIDEGCGVATGPLQFTIAWSEPEANVDLVVTDPAGEEVSAHGTRAARSGLRLERDCPAPSTSTDTCAGQNFENVVYEGADPPRGHYRAEVRLVDPHGARGTIVVRCSARVGSRTYGPRDVELSAEDHTSRTAFDVTL
jgi:tRNA (guanosine-2'-O-)-methyltransferase